MAKRKPTATQRLRKLVQQQVRRMENRGYRIDTELKEKIKTGKYQTLQSIRKNKYAKLYAGSSPQIDSKIVSGKKYRTYERKVAAEKGAITRRVNEELRYNQRKAKETYDRGYRDAEEYGYDENYTDEEYGYDEDYEEEWEEQHQTRDDWEERRQHEWEEARAKQDEADLAYANAIDEGRVMYQNVLELMEKFPVEARNSLYKGLESEIRQYGLDMVMAGMAYAPIDVVQEAQNIIFSSAGADKESAHKAFVNFFDAITGTIRTIQDSMGIGTVLDQMTDMATP